MADNDEWIYVVSCKEMVKKPEAAVTANDAIAAAPGEENPSKNVGDVDSGAKESSNDDDDAQADEDGEEEETRSDGGSYDSTELNEYLDYIEDVEEEEENDDDNAVTGVDDAVAETLRTLTIGSDETAPGAAVSRDASSGGGDRGKGVVVENPDYDFYRGGGRLTGTEAAYLGGSQNYGSSRGMGLGSSSRGYELGGSSLGSGSASCGYYGFDYNYDRYGTGGYGYNSYDFRGSAYGYTLDYGYYVDAYGSGYAYNPIRSVQYMPPPPGFDNGTPYYLVHSHLYPYPVQGVQAQIPPQFRRHPPPRAGEMPDVGPPQPPPDPSASI